MLDIIAPGSLSSDYVISLTPTVPLVIFSVIDALLYFCIAIYFHSILSIYAFYIAFRSEDENYHLFLTLVRERIWKVFTTSFSAAIRIVLGTVCLIIPGIVLFFRYFAINYFVIVENADFHAAKVKSAEVIPGFKFLLFLLFLLENTATHFIFEADAAESIVKIAIEYYAYILISCYESTFIYTICRHEANKEVVVMPEMISNDTTPPTITNDTEASPTPTTASTKDAPRN